MYTQQSPARSHSQLHTNRDFSSLSQGGTPAVLNPAQRCSPWAPWASCCCCCCSFSSPPPSLSLSLSFSLCQSVYACRWLASASALLLSLCFNSHLHEGRGGGAVVELDKPASCMKNDPDLLRNTDSTCTQQKQLMERHSYAAVSCTHTRHSSLATVAVVFMCLFAVECTVWARCLRPWGIYLCAYLLQQGRQAGRQATGRQAAFNGWATVYRMTTQLEQEGSNWFEQQILKQKGVYHRDQRWDKEGRSERAVVHMFFESVRGERQGREEELLWKLSQHQHLGSHWIPSLSAHPRA